MTEVTTLPTRENFTKPPKSKGRLCYSLSWKPDIGLLSDRQLSEYCERTRPDRVSDAEFYEDLGFVLLRFMSDALDAIFAGNSLTPDSHLHKYVGWAKFQVERFHDGVLPNLSNRSSKWTLLSRDSRYRKKLTKQLESTNQGKFFVSLGRQLPQILQGFLDPLPYMFQDDSVPNFYREINNKVICYEPFNQYLDLMCHKHPGIKVLEIGAGTGATTAFILKALSSHRENGLRALDCNLYDYTDISPAFFETAAGDYQEHSSRMRFKVLDIEADPAIQGFDLGTYDLIVAASVLHATKNLETTMRNTRALLKPGGKIVMFEVTQDVLRARFAFGLLPGWWLSEEDYRQWGPVIPLREWDDLLRRTGFSGIDLDIPDYLDERCHEYTIMCSTAIDRAQNLDTKVTLDKLNAEKACIIIDRESSMQRNVADKLRASLLPDQNMVCHVCSLEQAATSTFLGCTFVLSLVELENPLLSSFNDESFAAFQCIVTKAPGLLWVTGGGGMHVKDPRFHLIDGLARVARTELNKIIFVTLALEQYEVSSEDYTAIQAQQIRRVFEQTLDQSAIDFEPEYVVKNGTLGIGRVLQDSVMNDEIQKRTQLYQQTMQPFGRGPPLSLHILSPGSLESLQFRELVPALDLAPEEIELKVKATGVNFLDCLTALGQVDSKILGAECAGVVTRVGPGCQFVPGDRVLCQFSNTYQTYTRGSARCAAKIPDGISFAEASALPLIFCTAWIALNDTARLQPGETILIHAGAGGTGQAAIQVAEYLGAEVYVTVGSDEKKRLVMDTYSIPEDHIFYSRNLSFAQGIMRMTKNLGVDVILNSLAGEGLRASWECIAPLGRFIEIGKRDINTHASLPMWQFHKNATFSSVHLMTVTKERPSMSFKALSIIMDLIVEKKLHVPKPFQTFGISEVEDVFRLMQSGRNVGKFAIELREEDVVETVLRTKPDYQFEAESSYVIAGGLGGLGRSAARWMASRGVKHLILLSRSSVRSQASIALLEDLNSMGVHVTAPACDVSDEHSLSAVLAECAQTSPAIKGAIQASMVLKDSTLERMTVEDWQLGIKPKVQGSWNLHTLLPKKMDFFVCLSSISGIVGQGGQANYAAGNTFMDALVRHRVAHGEKANSLDLGWMESEGVVAESTFLSTGIASAGHLLPISQTEFHALLDYHCDPARDLGSGDSCQSIIGPEMPAAMLEKGLKEPSWMQRPTFRHLRQIGLGGVSSSLAGKAVDYAALLREAASIEEAARVVIDGLVQKLSRALSVPAESLDTSKPLHAYGVDSLLAVELRNYFAKEFGADVTVFEISGGSSFDAVSMTVAKQSKFCVLVER